MGLPKYIVNLEEVLKPLLPNYDENDNNSDMEVGCQRTKGIRLVTGKKDTIEETWMTPSEISITGISINISSDNKKYYGDSLDIYIGGELVFNNVAVREIQQYKNFRVSRKVEPYTEIKFMYNNNGEPEKEIWIDIDYTSKPLLVPVIIRALDSDTGDELSVDRHPMSLGTYMIPSPIIYDYYLIGDYYRRINIDARYLPKKDGSGGGNSQIVVDFLYKKK